MNLAIRSATRHTPRTMLECEGRPILSQGEFRELMKHLGDDGLPNSGTLQAWFAGEPVTALELWAALTVDASLAAQSERGHELIDIALSRLDEQVPDLADGRT